MEKAGSGPIEQQNVTALRELASDRYDFAWGYNGSGTSRGAAAILADALELEDPVTPASPSTTASDARTRSPRVERAQKRGLLTAPLDRWRSRGPRRTDTAVGS